MRAGAPVGIGVVGCGGISSTYFDTLTAASDEVTVVGCTDLDAGLAEAAAARYGLHRFGDAAGLMASGDVDVVLNLTPPAAHAAVSEAALRADRHVYSEKPLAATFADGRRLVELAAASGLRLGCAPDTFLGTGWQTARRLVDEGAIGEPVAADAAFLSRGHESWHPRPGFYYDVGGGPLLDMGPYYLTGLVSLLGPIARAAGAARASWPERRPAEGPNAGTSFTVRVPTHIVGTVEFAAGPIATLTTSFDVWTPEYERVLLYGSEATLQLPDPNIFAGRLRRWAPGGAWEDVPLDAPADPVQARGLGLLEMCRAVAAGRDHRASGELALHVLETMHAILDAAGDGRRRELETGCERPAALSLAA